MTALAVDPTNSAVVYAGEAGGGVWKSTNSGTAWAPLTDGQASMAIGAIAIDPSNSLTVYAATGEDNGSGDAQYGNGILKSLDGGTTWTLVDGGFLGQLHIGGIAVDRTTATAGTQHVFAATDVGLFESTNGGVNWAQNASLLTATGPSSNGSPSGGVFQIIQDPTTSGKWWASVADFGASEWGSIAQSTDGGVTWANNHTVGSSANKMQRIGLGVGTGGASGVAYAAPADLNGDLYDNQIQKTTDGGATWSAITVPAPTGGTNYFDFGGAQGWYDNVVAVDPTNNNHVLFGGVDALRTSDGGTSFHYVGNVYNGGFIHPDFHAVAFTGAADHAYVGNDGGVWSTADLGGSASVTDWANLNATLTTITYYAGAALDSQTLLGGAQDNGTSGHLSGAQALPAFQSYLGGDGGYTAITPDAQTVYGEFPSGKIYEGSPTLSGAPPEMGSTTAASPCDFSVGTGACLDNVSFVMPYALDRLNPSRLVAGTSRVWESNSGGVPAGSGWHVISPDLTYNPLCSGCDFISALTIVPGTGTIFTGSHFGKVFMTTNDGANWTDITGSGIPDPATVSNLSLPRDAIGDIKYNPSDANELWIAYGGVDFSSPRGRVFHTTNAAAGPTVWTDISGSGGGALPADPARSLYVDPTTPGTVYVGTWHGVYTCTTCGAGSPTGPSWSLLGSGLPQVEVSQMTPTSDGKVLAWTFGRGVWSLASVNAYMYLPLATPQRLEDTRSDGKTLSAGGTVDVQVAGGSTGVPSSAASVVLNVTSVNNAASGFLQAYPKGGRTNASAVNYYYANQLTQNLVTVPVDPSTGKVTIFSSQQDDVVVDEFGYYGVAPSGSTAGQYKALSPQRICDTRGGNSSGCVGATTQQSGGVLHLQVDGNGGVPASGVSAVVINVTVADDTAAGFVQAYAHGTTRPTTPQTSNVNFNGASTVFAGDPCPGNAGGTPSGCRIIANRVIVPVDSTGGVDLYTNQGPADLIVDVNGYFTDGTASTNQLFTPTAVSRLHDTRTSGDTIPANGNLNLAISGSSSVIPLGASAAVLNVTIDKTTAPSTAPGTGFLTVFPGPASAGGSPPLISDLNFPARSIVPAAVYATLGSDGTINIHNGSPSPIDVIVDAYGYFSASSPPG